MTQHRNTRPPRLRLLAAAGLGLTSIAVSILLIAADGVAQSARWAHHAGVSAAPLLLAAGAIAAISLARPAQPRRNLMRLVAILAFTAWGLAQLLPRSAAAGYLNDVAILLFVTDTAYAVISDTRTSSPPATAQPTQRRHLEDSGRTPLHRLS